MRCSENLQHEIADFRKWILLDLASANGVRDANYVRAGRTIVSFGACSSRPSKRPRTGSSRASVQSTDSAASHTTEPMRGKPQLHGLTIDSITSTTESQQPTALNSIDFVAIEQPAANAQDPSQLCTIQSETSQSDQEPSMGLQLRWRDQQLVPQSATVDESVLAPHGGFTSKAITQLFPPVPNLRSQLQLSVQMRVADTAKSIWFAMKGDTGALKRLFSEGLSSPEEVSTSRELSLLGVG